MNYTISEEYVLPSLGKIYPEGVNPRFKLRSMTTNEEMLRLGAKSDRLYKIMSDIIDACVVEGLGISAYDLAVSDYQYVLHRLRVVTYGPKYPISAVCPYCGDILTDVVDLDEFPVKSIPDDFEKLLSVTLPVTGAEIELNIQTPRLMDLMANLAKSYLKSVLDKSAIGNTDYLFNIISIIKTINGAVPNPANLELWVRSLPMRDTNTLIRLSNKVIEAFGSVLDLEISCEKCGNIFKSPFRVTSEFFGPTDDL